MKIGGRELGRAGGDVYVIAEIGVNHDGSASRAGELVRAAREAGADAVKFQIFQADLLMSRAARLAAYQAAAGERDPIEMLRRLELSLGDFEGLIHLAHGLGLAAIATVFSVELIGPAASLAWDAFKTASPDIVHRPLLRGVAETGRPVIVSTGASTLDEVRRAVGWLDDAVVQRRLGLLQCVSAYPVAEADAALEGVAALRREFSGLPVGYSDHTTSAATGGAGVEWGATILEKHLTYDRTSSGPDHAASLDPAMFVEYVRTARAAHPRGGACSIMGVKRVLDVEADVRSASRQSIVVRRDLPEGHVLTGADVTFKRPGTGLEPWQIDRVIGARLNTRMAADTPVTFGVLSGRPVVEAAA